MILILDCNGFTLHLVCRNDLQWSQPTRLETYLGEPRSRRSQMSFPPRSQRMKISVSGHLCRLCVLC